MSTKEAYKIKIEAELELAKAQLNQLKARAKISSADAAIEFSKEIQDLEKNLSNTKTKLKDLAAADDTVWTDFKEGADHAWSALKTSVSNAAAKFQK
ncbi:hypothetical protein [Aminivibrio sp.]|uniref:hypothetical protein n=1 Tax=Aminivibrio sp. TaxID=1872489 RepID=UPI001A39D583|nr:hypothetical protein [Aminivibrio sp.]MBL3538197.1 hypothetical protein [Aminivibrio sp.]MDK2958165.1 hypothetical protein [Synergistaceae bacterium]